MLKLVLHNIVLASYIMHIGVLTLNIMKGTKVLTLGAGRD